MISKYTNSLRLYASVIISAHILAFFIYFPIISFVLFVTCWPVLYVTMLYAMVYNYCKQEGIDFPYEKGLPLFEADIHMTPFYYLNDYDPFIDYLDYDPRY